MIFHLGLIGYPLEHSLSPKIHTAALHACNLRGHYSLFPIAPDDKQGLGDLLTRVRSGELHGLNVTIPHKLNVIPFMDELTPTAQAISAVNSIYLRCNKLIGDNTDAPGFLSSLNKFLGNRKSEIENRKSVLVLGAGGSARAVVYALLEDGWQVTLAARRLEQAREVANLFANYQFQITNLPDLQPLTFDLMVNTTPIGMTPNIDHSPLPENAIFPSGGFVYDLVYNPRETKLIREARAQGLHATTGLGMLIEQAALAFDKWTDCNPPRKALWNAIEN